MNKKTNNNIVLPADENKRFKAFLYGSAGRSDDFKGEILIDDPQIKLCLDTMPSTLSFSIPEKLNGVINPRVNEILDSSQIEIVLGEKDKEKKHRFIINKTPQSVSNQGEVLLSFTAEGLESELNRYTMKDWKGVKIQEEFFTAELESAGDYVDLTVTPSSTSLRDKYRVVRNHSLSGRTLLYQFAPQSGEETKTFSPHGFKNIKAYVAVVNDTTAPTIGGVIDLKSVQIADIESVDLLTEEVEYRINPHMSTITFFETGKLTTAIDKTYYLFVDYEYEVPMMYTLTPTTAKTHTKDEYYVVNDPKREEVKFTFRKPEANVMTPFYTDPKRSMTGVEYAEEDLDKVVLLDESHSATVYFQTENPSVTNSYSMEEEPKMHYAAQNEAGHYLESVTKNGVRIDQVIGDILNRSMLDEYSKVYDSDNNNFNRGNAEDAARWTAKYSDKIIEKGTMLYSVDLTGGTALTMLASALSSFSAATIIDRVNRIFYIYGRDEILDKATDIDGVEYGQDYGLTLQEGKYIETIGKEINLSNLVTVMKGQGKDGINLAGMTLNSAAELEDYSYFTEGYELLNAEAFLDGSDEELMVSGSNERITKDFAAKLLLWEYVNELAKPELYGDGTYKGLSELFDDINEVKAARIDALAEFQENYINAYNLYIKAKATANYSSETDLSFEHSLDITEKLEMPEYGEVLYPTTEENEQHFNTSELFELKTTDDNKEIYAASVQRGQLVIPCIRASKLYGKTMTTEKALGETIVKVKVGAFLDKFKVSLKLGSHELELEQAGTDGDGVTTFTLPSSGSFRSTGEYEHAQDGILVGSDLTITAGYAAPGDYGVSWSADEIIANADNLNYEIISMTSSLAIGQLSKKKFDYVVALAKWYLLNNSSDDTMTERYVTDNHPEYSKKVIWKHAAANALPVTENILLNRFNYFYNSLRKDNFLAYYEQLTHQEVGVMSSNDKYTKYLFDKRDYIELESIRKIKTYQNENIGEPRDLLTMAEEELSFANYPEITIKVGVVDLIGRGGTINADYDKVKIGSLITIFHPKIKVDRVAQIKEISYNPQANTMALTISTVKDYNNSQENFTSTVLKRMQTQASSSGSATVTDSGGSTTINQVVFSGSSTGLQYSNEGVHVFDDQGNKIVLLNEQGVSAGQLTGEVKLGKQTRFVDEQNSGAITMGHLDNEGYGLKIKGNQEITISDSKGFNIDNAKGESVFAADNEGNLSMKGKITAEGGEFIGNVKAGRGAVTIGPDGLTVKKGSTETFTVDPSGDVEMRGNLIRESDRVRVSITDADPLRVQAINQPATETTEEQASTVFQVSSSGDVAFRGDLVKIEAQARQDSEEIVSSNVVTGDGTLGMDIVTGINPDDALKLNADVGLLQNYAIPMSKWSNSPNTEMYQLGFKAAINAGFDSSAAELEDDQGNPVISQDYYRGFAEGILNTADQTDFAANKALFDSLVVDIDTDNFTNFKNTIESGNSNTPLFFIYSHHKADWNVSDPAEYVEGYIAYLFRFTNQGSVVQDFLDGYNQAQTDEPSRDETPNTSLIIQTQLKGGLTIRKYGASHDLLDPAEENFAADFQDKVDANLAENILTIDPVTGDLKTKGYIEATGGRFVGEVEITDTDEGSLTVASAGLTIDKGGLLIEGTDEVSGDVIETLEIKSKPETVNKEFLRIKGEDVNRLLESSLGGEWVWTAPKNATMELHVLEVWVDEGPSTYTGRLFVNGERLAAESFTTLEYEVGSGNRYYSTYKIEVQHGQNYLIYNSAELVDHYYVENGQVYEPIVIAYERGKNSGIVYNTEDVIAGLGSGAFEFVGQSKKISDTETAANFLRISDGSFRLEGAHLYRSTLADSHHSYGKTATFYNFEGRIEFFMPDLNLREYLFVEFPASANVTVRYANLGYVGRGGVTGEGLQDAYSAGKFTSENGEEMNRLKVYNYDNTYVEIRVDYKGASFVTIRAEMAFDIKYVDYITSFQMAGSSSMMETGSGTLQTQNGFYTISNSGGTVDITPLVP